MSGTIYSGAKLKKVLKRKEAQRAAARIQVSLKKGDPVIVISGVNDRSRLLKGKVSKIVRFVGENRDKVLLDGLNIVTRHTRQTGPTTQGGKIPKEAPVHVSNIMYYVEKLKRPVRIKHKQLEDGRKVRGYMSPETKEFVQID